jgi:hypothetical protein
MFAAFEGFAKKRMGELAAWLKSQAIPLGHYPSSLHHLTRHNGVRVLHSLMNRDDTSAEVAQALIDLGDSWTRLNGGGVWAVPHVAMMWAGSNLGAPDVLDVLRAFDVVSDWSEISGVGNLAGFSTLPNQALFKEIANRRHSAAHDAAYDADILLLRATPAGLIALAFAIDALLSSAVRYIQRGLQPLPHGRKLVSLVRIDEDPGSNGMSWQRFDGATRQGVTPVATLPGDRASVAGQINGLLNQPGDILLVRAWDGTDYYPVDWLTSGV